MAKEKTTAQDGAKRLAGMDPYLKDCMTLEPSVIDEEFSRLPGDYAYWNERYTEANKSFLLAEANEKQVNARVYITIKEAEQAAEDAEEAEDDGEKKKKAKKRKAMTVDHLDALVRTNPEMVQATERRIIAEVEKDHLRGVLDAMRTKREALVSLAANMRQEQKVSPSMKALTDGFNDG